MAFLNRLKKKAGMSLPKLAAIVLSTSLLASCGGGGDQEQKFQASRVIVFGDEASLINPNGSKYTVNAVTANNTLNCALNPLWVQIVASDFGHVFQECNPAGATPRAFMRAAYGAKVADVKTQIDAFVAAGGFAPADLVTVMAGNNDLLALFDANPRSSEAAMLAAADAAGTLLGDQVLRLTALGAKVLISTLPNLRDTPLGRYASGPDQTLLNNLSTRFNDKLRVRLADDPNGGGRSGALLSADDEVAVFLVNYDNQFGFSNVIDPACAATLGGSVAIATASLPTACTTVTANPGAANYLWAGRVQLSGLGNIRLGERAVLRVRNNPL